MQKHEKQFTIYYHDVDYLNRINLVSIMNYFQETAFEHLDKFGSGFDGLLSNNQTWMIYRWYIKIYKYPKWKEVIKVRTWLSEAKSFKGSREFEVRNNNDEIIIKAKSISFLIDTQKMKPKKITANTFDTSIIISDRAVEYNPTSLIPFEEYNYKKSFHVRQTDIDTNMHVNNTVYAEWFLETLPVEHFKNYYLESLEILYKKETKYGQIINVQVKRVEERLGEIIYLGQITDDIGNYTTLLKGVFKKESTA